MNEAAVYDVLIMRRDGWAMMTSTAAKSFATVILSLGLMLGASPPIAKAGDANSKNTQSVKQKKPVATSNKDDCKDASTKPRTRKYAKTGICTDCKPIALPYTTEQPCKPAKPKPVQNAKAPPPTKMPRGWANPDNCKYVRQDDHDSAGHSLWEAEKTACNQAGYPTPWSDKENRTASPTPTPDDRSLGEKIRDAVDVKGHIQSEHDKAQGQRPDCTNTGTLQGDVNDALSGCQ